jgi:hypothetical protein
VVVMVDNGNWGWSTETEGLASSPSVSPIHYVVMTADVMETIGPQELLLFFILTS